MIKRLVPLVALLLCACTDATADASDDISAAPTVPAETLPDGYAQFAAMVARHQAMSERVHRISRRLRVANAPLCDLTRLDIGLTTHRLDDYPPALQRLASHFMGLDRQGRFIRSVVPDSPADRVGLRAGERVVSGWPLRDDSPIVTDDGSGPAQIALDPDAACIAPAFVIHSPRPNASTDGREIELSTALVEQVGDDAALALIIAHEMSHALRGHSVADLRWDIELQADADALILMHNAGYDIAGTVAAWEAGVEVHRESQSRSLTHPPVDIRLRNLQDTLQRLEAGAKGFMELADD